MTDNKKKKDNNIQNNNESIDESSKVYEKSNSFSQDRKY